VVTDIGERHSVIRVIPPLQPRNLKKVPYIELADGRLQGVVSSGSDVKRVYVSSFTAGTHTFSCSTNNNRKCGGLGSRPCKHLRLLAAEAILQYGMSRVARYLRVDGDLPDSADALADRMGGGPEPAEASVVFSRFLHYLAYLRLPVTTAPLPELHWFPSMKESS